MVWNVPGAAKFSFHSTFRRWRQIYSPNLCVLPKTYLTSQGLARARHHFPPSWRFYAVESKGLTGGIIVVWRPGVAEIDVFHRTS